MRIFELYQEERGSEIVHDGHVYDLNKLLRLTDHLDIDEIPVDQLAWILEYDDVEDEQDKRADDTDLSAPILTTWWWNEDGHSQLVVLDGAHRVAKAYREGIRVLPGRYVDADILAKCNK